MRRRRSTGLLDLRPLAASADFRRLWLGTSLGAVGHQMTVVAVLFQVWQLTGSPVWTGAVGLASAVPLLLLGVVGGSLADARDRRTVVRWATTGQVVAALGLVWQATAGLDHLGLLLALVAAQSAASGLGAPARRTLPTRLLPRPLVPAGIALQQLSFQVAMLTGPALAGLLISASGVAACYAVEAAAFLVVLHATWRLPPIPPLGEVQPAGWRSVVDGLRQVARMPAVRGSYAVDLAATVLAMPVALFPLVNEVWFGGGPETLGLFLSAVAVGGVLAGLWSGAVTRAERLGAVQLSAAATWGVALGAFGFSGSLPVALLALAVAGAADTVSVVSRAALVQLVTPDSHRGRVSAVEHVIGVAGPDVGNARAGLVAGWTSAPVALVSGGVLCLAAVTWVGLRNRELRRFRTGAGLP